KDFDNAIMNFIKRERGLLISERTAEEIKMNLGATMPLEEELSAQIVGKSCLDGVPRAITVTSTEICQAILDTMMLIAKEVIGVLDYVTPQTLADIFQKGIIVTGGSSLIRRIDKFLEEKLQIHVFCAEEPLLSVVHGISKINSNPKLLEKVRLK